MTVPVTAAQSGEDRVCITFDDLVGLIARILARHGASECVAAVLAKNCASAERDGSRSHGIFRVPGYVSTLRSGWVDGHAEPQVEERAGAFLAVDAKNGFAQPALELVQPMLAARARTFGIALAAIRESHHFGALWLDVEPFAREGLVALAMVNATARVVPFGARTPVYGTNPMAFAVPRAGGPPIVFDQASSAMSNGDVRLAAREGRPVPVGTGVDRNGAPTTDAAAIVAGGGLLPFGEHKGSSIAMMIEIMAAALTGGQFSFEVDASGYSGAETARAGELLIVIDPAKGAGADFARRIEILASMLVASGQVRMPGDRRYARRDAAQTRGLRIPAAELQKLRSFLDD